MAISQLIRCTLWRRVFCLEFVSEMGMLLAASRRLRSWWADLCPRNYHLRCCQIPARPLHPWMVLERGAAMSCYCWDMRRELEEERLFLSSGEGLGRLAPNCSHWSVTLSSILSLLLALLIDLCTARVMLPDSWFQSKFAVWYHLCTNAIKLFKPRYPKWWLRVSAWGAGPWTNRPEQIWIPPKNVQSSRNSVPILARGP